MFRYNLWHKYTLLIQAKGFGCPPLLFIFRLNGAYCINNCIHKCFFFAKKRKGIQILFVWSLRLSIYCFCFVCDLIFNLNLMSSLIFNNSDYLLLMIQGLTISNRFGKKHPPFHLFDPFNKFIIKNILEKSNTTPNLSFSHLSLTKTWKIVTIRVICIVLCLLNSYL